MSVAGRRGKEPLQDAPRRQRLRRTAWQQKRFQACNYTAEAIAFRKHVTELLRDSRQTIAEIKADGNLRLDSRCNIAHPPVTVSVDAI